MCMKLVFKNVFYCYGLKRCFITIEYQKKTATFRSRLKFSNLQHCPCLTLIVDQAFTFEFRRITV